MRYLLFVCHLCQSIAVYDDIMGLLSFLTIYGCQCLYRKIISFSYSMCVTVQNVLNTSEPCLFITI